MSTALDKKGKGASPPTISIPIDPDAVTTDSLQDLQSDEQRKVMDIVDNLRRTGLSGVIELPQLVVCGDQSSGKSSVLEAITQIPFPRKENLCTRFATEIILRRSPSSTISITITPDKLRLQHEQEDLKSFSRSICDFEQLPDIIDEATEAMRLGVVGGIHSRAYSRDVLSVQICGPDRPHLTLVDLPGLIHSSTRAQTGADKDLIVNLVTEYINNPRTIILAVVSAKNDMANQIILESAREADKDNKRTLGIITKPDFLLEGSRNESSWIDVAQNNNVYLKRGWHMLKNRGDDEMDISFAKRNEAETLFFNKGRYLDLPRECVGIESLRERLSKLLLNHLIKELPSLMNEMKTKLEDTKKQISELGEKRTTIDQQRTMLVKVYMKVNDTLKCAVQGYYESSFFGSVNRTAAVDSIENIKRFRAVIQHRNTSFAHCMRMRGQKFAIGVGPGDDDNEVAEVIKLNKEINSPEDDGDLKHVPKSTSLTHKQAIDWVKNTLERTRGYELPGTFQPMLISQLFWEQSEPWEKIALHHITGVATVCKDFVHTLLQYATPNEAFTRTTGLSVDAALENCLTAAKEELAKLIKDKSRHPSTYNHYFTTTVQKQRQRKYQKITKRAVGVATQIPQWTAQGNFPPLVDPAKMEEAMSSAIEQDMDTFSSQEALEFERAYYKDEMKYFIECVCKQCIERHLVEPLPDVILPPLSIMNMSEEDVQFIAAEPPEITQQRIRLESRLNMLNEGIDTFSKAMTSFRG